MTKGLSPLRKQNISKKAQGKYDEIKKKLYTADRNWNYWKFQLHWNKIEGENTRNKTRIKNPIQFL